MKNQNCFLLYFFLLLFTVGCSQKIAQSIYTDKNELPSEYVVTEANISSARPPPNQITHYEADVISHSDYYPYGMQMPGRYSGDYRFGFNGMEEDDEVRGRGTVWILGLGFMTLGWEDG